MFETKVLRKIFGHNRQEVTGGWENRVMGSVIICTAYRMLLG